MRPILFIFVKQAEIANGGHTRKIKKSFFICETSTFFTGLYLLILKL